jgi:hypothetical protein
VRKFEGAVVAQRSTDSESRCFYSEFQKDAGFLTQRAPLELAPTSIVDDIYSSLNWSQAVMTVVGESRTEAAQLNLSSPNWAKSAPSIKAGTNGCALPTSCR